MIRLANSNDLEKISKVHMVCFPKSYSSQLGKFKFAGGNLLNKFYNEYLTDAPNIFYVACDNKEIVGFCMGYYMDNDQQMQKFLSKNKIKISIKTICLLLSFNKQTWNKVLSRIGHKPQISDWEIVNKKYEKIGNDKRGDLLSVCVLPEFRGKGYSQELMDAFLKGMKQSGKNICLLSVDADNARARKYYERNGFEIYRKRGDEGLTYIKPL